jgi:3'-phosphoadenosine 5'-phosphosulfate sulfotransferase (PAPS reductase)/FAD synthetase
MTPPVDALMRHRPAAGSKAAHTSGVLQDWQRCALVDALAGRLIVLCFGSGVDSTAMIVALRAAGLRPHVNTFADTGGEKPETLRHVTRMNEVLRTWGWPEVSVCRKVPMASTGYTTPTSTATASRTRPCRAWPLA